MNIIPFNKPVFPGKTLEYISDALNAGHVSGDGKYTKLCSAYLKKKWDCRQALLVHSGTAALELAAIMCNLSPGDEVIMPSYTFVSTANAFVLQGAVPVFVDIRPDTLNLDEQKIEEAITPRTKAICAVHYAGVACNMEAINTIARRHNLLVVEDAAQAWDSEYKGKPLGLWGDMGAFSLHETKNIMSGEGGIFVTNNQEYGDRAEIAREKGTNRSRFFRGQVDKYTWVDKGSSYLPSDLIAAYLYAVLENSKHIQQKRLELWQSYHEFFAPYEAKGILRRPIVPADCKHNAHMYYILMNSLEARSSFISEMKHLGITTPFHYIPLHSAPAGKQYGRFYGDMSVTDKVSDTLVRMPMYYDINNDTMDRILSSLEVSLEKA